jgi:HEAT repeat protein
MKNSRWNIAAAGLLLATAVASAQVAPLAPRWLAGNPTPLPETFADGLARHHIDITETSLLAALQDKDGEVRSLAAAQLAAADDHPALKFIIRAMESERNPQVQVNLAGASTWLGSQIGLKQLETMCADINVPSLARLDAARYVSNKDLPTCFASVRDIAHDEQDPAVRAQAVYMASRYRGHGDEAQGVAAYALNDVDPTVRITAADALLSLRATGTIGALESATQKEGDETVREHMRGALRTLKIQLAAKPQS